jgi:hypothetical protein
MPAAHTQQMRSLSGVATNQNGHPLSGAVVQIEDTRTLLVRSYITDSRGKYRFQMLYSDVDYKLHATYRGHSSRQKNLSKFSNRSAPVINLVVYTIPETAGRQVGAAAPVPRRHRNVVETGRRSHPRTSEDSTRTTG